MIKMDTIYLAVILTFIGTAISVLLGWAEGEGPFNPRKLLSAIIRGLVGGLGVALLYAQSHPTLAAIDVVVLLFTPIGLDFSINQGWKVYKKSG